MGWGELAVVDIKPGLGEGVSHQPHSVQQGDVRPSQAPVCTRDFSLGRGELAEVDIKPGLGG